jgi:hypothetical protein
LGVSVWVELLLGKFFSHQPIERQLSAWRLRDLDLAPGTVNGGLQRLEPLFTGVYEAFFWPAVRKRISLRPMKPAGWS